MLISISTNTEQLHSIVVVSVCLYIPNKDNDIEKLFTIYEQISKLLGYVILRNDEKFLIVFRAFVDICTYDNLIYDPNKLIQLVNELIKILKNKNYSGSLRIQETIDEFKEICNIHDIFCRDKYVDVAIYLFDFIYSIFNEKFKNVTHKYTLIEKI